jgi:hypothetical protein
LYSEAREIRERLTNARDEFEIPVSGLEADIIVFLAKFATSTRYYNLNFLSGKSQPSTSMDPIAEWRTGVGTEILKRHYSRAMREKDKRNAAIASALMGPVSWVQHIAEDGEIIDSVESASLRTGENKVMQKYGTFYCAKVVRFAYLVLYDLEGEAIKAGFDDVPALHEFFFPFLNKDAYLKSRKTFPAQG